MTRTFPILAFLLLVGCPLAAEVPVPTASAAIAPESPAPELVLVRIPPPRLEGLEPAVRDQLQESAARLARWSSQDDGSAEAMTRDELSERFGELGHLYHAYELWPAAEAAYENARRLEEGEPTWPYSLGVVAFKKGELARAKNFLAASLKLAENNPFAKLYLAEIALQEGDAAEAARLANEVLQALPASPAALVALGRAALLAEQPKKAKDAFEMALTQVPEANRLHYLLAMAHRAAGDLETARQEMAKAGQVGVKIPDPLDPLLAEHRRGERVATVEGDLAMAAGRFGEAVLAYEKATRAQPKNAELWTRLGGARASAGDLSGAERDLRHALELDPFLPIGLLQLGRLLAFGGKHEEALSFFERHLDLDPQSVAGRREAGIALNRLGRRLKALEHLRPVVKALPADEEARLEAAVAAVELGLLAEARDLLEEGLSVDPSQGRLAKALARILAAAPDLSLRNGERALKLAQQVAAATNQVQDYELVALALAELGRCTEAADLLTTLAPKAEASRQAALLERAETWRKASSCRPPGNP